MRMVFTFENGFKRKKNMLQSGMGATEAEVLSGP